MLLAPTFPAAVSGIVSGQANLQAPRNRNSRLLPGGGLPALLVSPCSWCNVNMSSRENAFDTAGFGGHDAAYTRLVDHYSRYIESPVLRLRFLSGALGHECPARFRLAAWMRWLPVVNSLETRALLIVELSKFLPAGRRLPLSFGILS